LSEEKNFIQTIKLEISRNFKMEPYERMAFYRILGFAKSPQGMDILIKELDRGGLLRLKALRELVKFQDPSLVSVFLNLLSKDLLDEEILLILDFLSNFKSEEVQESLLGLLDRLKNIPEKAHLVRAIFSCIRKINLPTNSLLNFLGDILDNYNSNIAFLGGAIDVISVFKDVTYFENLLKSGDDKILYHVFWSIYNFNLSSKFDSCEDDEVFSKDWTPSKDITEEEHLLLNIKVLLGKMTTKFDSFSEDTAVAFINAMLTCNHRESSVYVLKALDSKNLELVKKTLHSLYMNLVHLKDPEKILRALVYMNTEEEIYDKIIVDIFAKYFSERCSSRSDSLFKDKQYGYIAVTLENFFETYRREFMIPEVMEKSLPDEIKIIRNFLLNRIDYEHNRKVISVANDNGKYLLQEERI